MSKSILSAVREPESTAVIGNEKAPKLVQQNVVWEVPLREVASLETELSALNLRRNRLLPDMEAFGEPLY